MLCVYKRKHSTTALAWETKYNFDTLEANLAAFEEELKSGRRETTEENSDDSDKELRVKQEEESENEDTSSLYYVLSHHPSMRLCILKDDKRDLETFDVDPEYVQQAINYFVSQIWRGTINNVFQAMEDRSQHLIVRFEDVLVELNQPNSRCFREILKWHYHLVKDENSFVSFTNMSNEVRSNHHSLHRFLQNQQNHTSITKISVVDC